MASLTENNMYHSLREVVELSAAVAFGASWAVTTSYDFGRVTIGVDAGNDRVLIRLNEGWPSLLGVYFSLAAPAAPTAVNGFVQGPYLLTDANLTELGFGDPTNAVAGTTVTLYNFNAGTAGAPATGSILSVVIKLLNTTVVP